MASILCYIVRTGDLKQENFGRGGDTLWSSVRKYSTASPLSNSCAWSSLGRQEMLQSLTKGGFDVRKGDRI